MSLSLYDGPGRWFFFSFFFHCFEPVEPEVRDSELGNGSKVIYCQDLWI